MPAPFRPVPACILAIALLVGGSTACTSTVVNGYLRGRPLGPGHVETGASMSWARRPAEGVAFREDEVEPDQPEPLSSFPAPVGHFRIGVTERVDAGLDVAPTGAALSGKFAIFDADQLMMAAVLRLGVFTQDIGGVEDDGGFRTGGAFSAALALPIATRPSDWVEVAVTPNLGFIVVDATRTEVQGEVSRGYTTAHAGFAVGASFAVWRVRINPEVNVVGVLRPDHDRGFLAAYPGVGAFFVY